MKTLTLTDAHYDELIEMLNDHLSEIYGEYSKSIAAWGDEVPLFTALDLRLEPRSQKWPRWPVLVKLDERAPSRVIE